MEALDVLYTGSSILAALIRTLSTSYIDTASEHFETTTVSLLRDRHEHRAQRAEVPQRDHRTSSGVDRNSLSNRRQLARSRAGANNRAFRTVAFLSLA